jgi:D-threo-aldose 1-dehydrogenase
VTSSQRVALTQQVTTTRLGFGCGGLMRLESGRARQRLLAAAFDSGIAHFDVARMYGLGQAEAELGRFARARRSEITVATKFGIEPRSGLSALARFQAPARALLARSPALRLAVKRRSELLDAPRRYDARTARRSLEQSLSQVGTDYFDILFLHDPRPTDDVAGDELFEFFAAAQREGKIRAWGIATDDARAPALLDTFEDQAVLQTRYDIFAREAGGDVSAERPLILFGFLSAALPRLTKCLADARIRDTFAPLLRGEEVTASIADYLLLDALEAHENAVLLVSTTSPARARRAAELSRTMTHADLDEFRRLLQLSGVLSS